MKWILIAILSFTLFAQAQTPLQEMVQTEQAFSRMAAEKNTQAAFMAFIADDGLLFRPGAVNGKKWMREHPVPPFDKRPLLAWQPAFAAMAAAGDLGFTTGPWEFKDDIKNEKPSGYGHFVTLWKKQPDGSWKFVVDLGISHPQSGGPQTIWQPGDEKQSGKVRQVDMAKTMRAIFDRDRAFSQSTTSEGLVKRFRAYSSPDVRLYRNGNLPFIGQTAAANALTSVKGQMSWTPLGGDVSRSGDLGYTHGTYEVSGADNKSIERGSYVHIWKNEGGVWRVVLDVTNAH